MKEKIAKILALSQKFQGLTSEDYEQEKLNVVNYLNKLSNSDLLNFKAKLEDGNPEKVRKVRLLVVNRLLENKSISIEDIEKIRNEEAGKHQENIFRSWKSYFSLFLPFIYKDKVDGLLNDIANQMIKDLGLENICKFKMVDFDGANNFGADRAWIAIYNKNQPNQSSSLQMFVDFNGEHVKYGLHRHSSKTNEPQTILNLDAFDYDQMILALEKDKQKIIDDTLFVRYWKFSPGDLAKYWEHMCHSGIAAIGWGNYSFVNKTRKEISQILLGRDPETTERSVGIVSLFNEAKSGDKIFAFKGRSEIVGIGEVTAAAAYSPTEVSPGSEYHNFLKVDWKRLNPPIVLSKMVMADCFSELTDRAGELDELIDNSENDRKKERIDMSLNQIFYGPPGTGKTFTTVNEALRILDPQFLEDNKSNRQALKARFDEFERIGDIRFVTFHQSFSYEDFVEGLTAVTENGQLKYKVSDGIFKVICRKSLSNLNPGLVFGQGYEVLRVTEEIVELKKPQGGKLSLPLSAVTDLAALVSSNKITVDDIKQKNVFEKIPELDLEKYLINGYPNVFGPLVESILLGSASDQVSRSKVLIIDEINRGNISRIFGELITLIEPSKRAGAEEALSVTLPYSKKSFTVPNNIYLIGTMNTADRSLANLDIALRRRFTFKEMPPKPELLDSINIQGLNIGELLRVMNQRIEVLLDRDHAIGHAYFMDLFSDNSLQRLALIFERNILPLLQEYFFEDWERISWVLNDQHKVEQETKFLANPNTGLTSLFGDTANNLQDRRWIFNKGALMDIQSYRGILGR